MAFTLPALPYATDALEPYIDKMTMEIHHGKHHNAYVTNLNKALESAPGAWRKSRSKICSRTIWRAVPEAIKTAVRNNGGGHWNYSMFWTILGAGGGQPSGAFGGRHRLLRLAVSTRLGEKFPGRRAPRASAPVGLG